MLLCYVRGAEWTYNTGNLHNADTGIDTVDGGSLEDCELQRESSDPDGLESVTSSGGTESGIATTSKAAKRFAKAAVFNKIHEYVRKQVCVPIHNVFVLKEWRSNPNNIMINLDCYQIKNILKCVEQEYIEYTVSDFYRLYSNGQHNILFKCTSRDEFNRKYLNYHNSCVALLEILYYQFNNDEGKVRAFIRKLYKMLDFKQGDIKKNGLWIKSPNSAGKNFFFDCLTDSFILVGYVKNPIKNYVFGFQNCVNKRALLWNEAVIDPYFYEDIKPILAGDSPNVQVKNAVDGTVRATPIFVLSNRDTFPDTPEFNCRVHKYNWRTCNLLKHYKRKPDPRVANLMLVCECDPETASECDRDIYVNSHNVIKNIIKMYGDEYWNNTRYLHMLKNVDQ